MQSLWSCVNDPTHPQGLRQAALVMAKSYNRSPDGEARAKLYNSHKWRNYSKDFLCRNGACHYCGGPANMTDHLHGHGFKPGHELGATWEERFWNPAGHVPACRGCNSRAQHMDHQRTSDASSYQAINERRAKLRAGVLPGGYRDRSVGGLAQQRPEGPYDTGNSMENLHKNGTSPKSASSRDKLINKLRGPKNG